jgi:glycosyltransferase involved in cell wall biosynthesis
MNEPIKLGTKTGSLICLVLPDLSGGGAERVNVDLAHEFLARGYSVDLVLMRREGDLLASVSSKARIVGLDVQRMREVPLAFARYLKTERPDAVLANMWPLTSMCVLAHRLARSRSRIAVCDHNTLSCQYAGRGFLHSKSMRASMAAAYRMADARVAVSAGVVDDLAALSSLERSQFDVIHNAYSPPAVGDTKGVDAGAAWGVPQGSRILSVGSFKLQKNQALLLRAFAQMGADQDARLLLLGEGPLRGELEALARAEGIGGKVLMPGFAQNPSPYYQSADLFVLSSDYEGFGNVIVEALACGLPVVSTDCPSGPREILDSGRFGKLVPVGDAGALAQAMTEELSRHHDREKLRRRAAEFSVEAAADKYLRLLFSDQNRTPNRDAQEFEAA